MDTNKPLRVLHEEWSGCTRCTLAGHRESSAGNIVHGHGKPGGLMVVGLAPGEEEAATGEGYCHEGGNLLMRTLEKMGFNNVYYTHTVACRSCTIARDSEGAPRVQRIRGVPTPVLLDAPPSNESVSACSARLHEEIYLVDPFLIVALGKAAGKALLGHPIKDACMNDIHQASAVEDGTVLSIEGAGVIPATTPKGAWMRKVHGERQVPVRPMRVSYPVIVISRPEDVCANDQDAGYYSPSQTFGRGMQRIHQLASLWHTAAQQDNDTRRAHE